MDWGIALPFVRRNPQGCPRLITTQEPNDQVPRSRASGFSLDFSEFVSDSRERLPIVLSDSALNGGVRPLDSTTSVERSDCDDFEVQR
jgi:hypothetical protein